MNFTTEYREVTPDGYILLVRLRSTEYQSYYTGYVGLPKIHKLCQLDYDDIDVDVHGKLTFANFGTHLTDEQHASTTWFFGFDCTHYNDSIDIQNFDYVLEEVRNLYAQLQQ